MNTEGLPQAVRDLPRAWQELGRTKQLAVGGVAGAIVIALIAAVFMFQQPQQVALYTNLADADAAAIAAKLKELKVPYAVADGGGTIRVPQASAADLRLQLASAGLPSGSGVGMVGMEIFDKTNFGITDFAQKLNYQRGLEGELTRTIGRLSPVESARVHLVLPAERLFTAQQKDTTASVVIKLKPASRLTDEQVTNIRFLVSKSVEGLKPDNVAVVDVNGNALGKLETGQGARDEQAATRLQLQRQREAELESKIQGMLTQVLGANRAVVRASLNLDWNDEKRTVESFTQGATLSRQDNREQFTGRGAEVAAPGGVPGVAANVATLQTVPGGAGNDSSFTSSKLTENNQPNSEKIQINKTPGEIKNLGIAVMVDQSVQAAQVDQITQVVTAAAGIQPARGDQVSVVTLPFDNSLSQQLRKQQEEQTLMDYVQLALRVGGIIVGLGGLFLLFRMMSNAVRPRPAQVVVAESVALPGGTAGLLPPVRVQQQLTAALEQSRALPSREEVRAELETTVRDELRAELEAVIRGQVMAEVDAELEAKRKEEQARQAEEDARRREEETVRAAEMAQQESARREQMRKSIASLASAKPEALADILGQWIEQGRTAAVPVTTRRATSALN